MVLGYKHKSRAKSRYWEIKLTMPGNFKSDNSFLRKLAVGAAGVNETIKN
jgi:hypothetical protein